MDKQKPPPNNLSKADIAKNAKTFINKTLPTILKSNKRAQDGVKASRLFTNPAPSESNHSDEAVPRISCRVADTLEAAGHLNSTPGSGKKPRIAILNMASPLRPGGGVLTGATSQEESLCSRTTLYPALREEFYRLPEIGGVYTPDVLVCRGWDKSSTDLFPTKDRFYVDVVTAAMLRFPDIKAQSGDSENAKKKKDDTMVYEREADRELALAKMKAVMRTLQANGVDRVVLGAWGCGAYANPVNEIAQGWRKVLLGGNKKGKGKSAKQVDHWGDMEIVFAINNRKMAEQFAACWGDDLVVENL